MQPQKKIELKVTQELVAEKPSSKSPEDSVPSQETSVLPPCIEDTPNTPENLQTSPEKQLIEIRNDVELERPDTPLEANVKIDQLSEAELNKPSNNVNPEDIQSELISEPKVVESESEIKLQPAASNSKNNVVEPPSDHSLLDSDVEIMKNDSQPLNEVLLATSEVTYLISVFSTPEFTELLNSARARESSSRPHVTRR